LVSLAASSWLSMRPIAVAGSAQWKACQDERVRLCPPAPARAA
jgi:hypothetical protein